VGVTQYHLTQVTNPQTWVVKTAILRPIRIRTGKIWKDSGNRFFLALLSFLPVDRLPVALYD
jgi:hypothetical protein